MDQCEKLEAFMNQGHIKRVAGRLRWSDGSNIIREPDETWVNAILQRIQKENKAREEEKKLKGKEVYFVNIGREESDADTDEQEDLGWESVTAPITHLHSFGADRPFKVSHEARKRVQNVPAKPHRMKEFTPRRNDHSSRRERNPIPEDADLHRSQDRPFTPTTPTPIDVSPEQFEGKVDAELVPMVIEDAIGEQSIHDKGKVSTRKEKSGSRDLIQVGSKIGKTQSAVVDEVLNHPLTIRVEELLSLAPGVRKALAKAFRTTRDDDAEVIDMIRSGEQKESSLRESKGKEVMRANVGAGRIMEAAAKEEESGPRKLLRIKAKIGRATMVGMVDSGSQENIISARMAAATGLPTVLLEDKSFPVQGVSGPPTRCKYMIPNAAIYMTDNQLLTRGDLFVVEGAKVDLLYGIPWIDAHEGRIYTQPDGIFVSWISEGQRHAMNATAWEYGDSDFEEETPPSRSRRGRRGMVASMVARARSPLTDLSCVLDSEEDQEPLFAEEYPDEEEDDEEAREAVRWARDEVARWARSKQQEEDGIEEELERQELSPPPNQLGRRKEEGKDRRETSRTSKTSSKRRKTGRGGRGFVEVDRDLEEELVRLEQENADEEEWAEFCRGEKKRMVRKDKDWLTWIQRESDDDEPAGTEDNRPHSSHGQDPIMDPSGSVRETWALPPESTHTLETPPQKSPKRATRSIVSRMFPSTTETTARRSRRTKWLTEKGQYGEQMKIKGRTYQRNERATRTVSRRTQLTRNSDANPIEEDAPQIFSFCLQAGPTKIGRGNLSTRRRSQLISQRETKHEPGNYDSAGMEDEYSPLESRPRTSREIEELEKGNDADAENEGGGEGAYPSEEPLIGINEDSPAGGEPGDQSVSGAFLEDQLVLAEESTSPDQGSDQIQGRSNYARLNSRRLELADGTKGRPAGETKPYSLGEHDLEVAIEKSPSGPGQGELERKFGRVKVTENKYDPPAGRVGSAGVRQRPHHLGNRRPVEKTNPERVKGETNEGGKLLPPGNANREATEPSPDPIIERESEEPRSTDDRLRTRDPRPMVRIEGEGKVSNENVREGCIVCGRSEPSPIKTRGGERKRTRTTSWLPRVPRLSKITKVACLLLAFLFVIFLLLVTIGRLLRPSPRINIRIAMHLKTIPLPPEGSSNNSPPPIPSSQFSESRHTYPPAPRTREQGVSFFDDPAKAALDSLPLPSENSATPAIIAVNHLESLPVQSSHPTHEFLGRGITVCIRNPNGHVIHHQGDLHLRLFKRGVEQGWEDVYLPSRTELDHLLGLWNREPGYRGAMAQIRTDFDKVRLISDDPPFKRSTWQTYEEKEEDTKEAEEKDDEVSRVPPNSPDTTIRVGPPLPTKVGQRARRRHPFPKRSTLADSLTRDYGLEALAEAAVKVKEEEDEDAPFRNGILAKSGPITEIEMVPLPQGSPPDIPPPPPELTYPDDDSGRTYLLGSSGKVTEFQGPFENPTNPDDDDDPPPPLLPASPPSNTLKRGRPSRAVLLDIVQNLRRLRSELEMAFDIETQSMIERMEKSTHRLLMTGVAKSPSEACTMVAGPDGDIVMREKGRAVSEGPGHQSTIPTEYSLSPASLSRFDELMDRVRTLQGMVMSYQWKKVDDQNDLDAKVDGLESRIASLEVLRIEDDATVTTRRRTYRGPAERPLTRGNANKLDNKIEQCATAINGLQTRFQEAEALLENLRGSRERVQEAERRIVKLEEAIGKQDTKFANLVARIDEVLQQGSVTRDPPTPHLTPTPGFYLRVSRIETNQLNFHQRISSNEEQLSLLEQRLRCFWNIGAASDPADALAQVAHLRNVWAAATLAWNRRQSQAHPNLPQSQPTRRPVAIIAPGPSRDHDSTTNDDPPQPDDKPGQY